MANNEVEPVIVRRRLLIRGLVQGVGFRPFVYNLARQFNLTGFAGNDSSGVFIEVQGPASNLDAFHADLIGRPPPLARIDSITDMAIPTSLEQEFALVESASQTGASTPISPDIATCADCLRELLTPTDRRFRYPFINCTNCGPRFTVVRDIPYDRPMTTMASFALCAACAAEYADRTNRRFHAEPNACPRCGPSLQFQACGQQPTSGEEAIAAAQQALARGNVVAVKGIGGFHLACDASNDNAVRELRRRKGRTDKPFAVLVANLEQARRYAHVNDQEAALLSGKEHPVVLVRRRVEVSASALSPLVAPGNAYLGLLLPFSPLHHLLMGDRPLVLTSGNLGEEPIAKDNDEALRRLADLADAFLLHDRDIHVVCDDSVVRVFEGEEYPIRRSRGYAPLPVAMPRPLPTVLAVGGELKATFCLTRDTHAYLSQHIGDMENLETLHAFERAFAHFETLFRASPSLVACDAHPGYLSSRWAVDFARTRRLPLHRVQHHHAHIGALMAEHGLDGSRPVIGVCFDGTGYGNDGAIWGGEVLLADYRSFKRLAHLRYIPLPGGDASIRKPCRSALAHLFAAGMNWDANLPCVQALTEAERRILRQQLHRNVHCVPTSSMGRLFDAVAAFLGIRQEVSYEAQAALEMEALAEQRDGGAYEFGCTETQPIEIDPAPVLWAIVADLHLQTPIARIAGLFHAAVARLVLRLAESVCSATGIDVIGLTGGVFQNVLLLELTVPLLRSAGFRVLVHRRVPTNDGGLALGQAAIACHLDRYT